MDENTQFSPRIVAKAIGVSESSLKRWCDQGLIQTSRTAGGHRRLKRSEVIRFVREQNISVAEPEVIGLPALTNGAADNEEALVELLRDALVSGKEVVARQLIFNLFVSGWELYRIFDDVIGRAFEMIGEMWEANQIDIYRERYAGEITMNVLRELRVNLPEVSPDAPLAIGAGLSGDHYSLPSLMVEMMLRSLGWKARALGTNIPLDSLHTASADFKPRLFWVSLSHIETEIYSQTSGFTQRFNRFADTLPADTALVLGGRAISPELRRQLRFTVCFDNMKQLHSYVVNPNHFKVADSAHQMDNGVVKQSPVE
ncbi:MAG: B12-binding domain-containing protein [Planctomycetota bacterium]